MTHGLTIISSLILGVLAVICLINPGASVLSSSKRTTGFADLSFVFGNAGDKPVAGDWNGDGIDTVGIYRNGLFYLSNSNATGFADTVFVLGNSGTFL